MVLVLRRFDLQPNIRERNPVVKRDPTVFNIEAESVNGGAQKTK